MKTVVIQTNRELEVLLVALTGSGIKGTESVRLAGKCLDSLEQVADIHYDAEGNIQVYQLEGGQVKIEEGRPVRASRLKEQPATLALEDAYFNFLKARIFEASEWMGAALPTLYRMLQRWETI